jgi:uncharacterized protein YndB with AHSA1/START domain
MNDRIGTITLDGETATMTFERRLAFPVDAVWAALTQPEQRARWFGPTTIDAREGGTIEMTAEGPPVSPEQRHMTGRILVWDPPRVFAHEWRQSIIGDTVVRYELEPDGDGTLLRLSHAQLAPRHAKGYIPGTHAYLDRLEAHLEGSPIPDWMRRFGEAQPAYA